ncbi:ribosome maturation factor RimM [Hoyosella subflava]|uniref:Ribosome maturation factor RimM n=1 Tax=Hoyosella subflava (strain DSM 45089 / JCM 17490 / NBRC 109087 / DQS3-9A1) TaxID=443218 RepID=F6EIV6_HOYSD|nr:ribosome maturation factor RimM [Hoyosella subflava]AEF40017.1 Ribosome maturation factor rimM [Hoyosella subflava DQS3-9A1]
MELVVGRIAKSHGIRGEIVVEVRTDEPEQRFAVGAQLRARAPRSSAVTAFTVEAAREHSGRLLVRLAGVADRESADSLRGMLFVVDSSELPASGDDEYYDHELEGLVVRFASGGDLGVIREVLHTAAGETLSIEATDGREVLIPFITDFVPVVDVPGGFVEVTPPDGLLEL